MVKDLVQAYSLFWFGFKAGHHQVSVLVRYLPGEDDLGPGDLLVLIKWNVSTDHGVEQDTKGPNCGRITMITLEHYPLWRRKSPSTWNMRP